MLSKEMFKLRMGLEKAGVAWEDNSEILGGTLFERTKFTNKFGVACSVIFVDGLSYGSKTGLLETMPTVHDDGGFDDEVEGFLSAEEILAEWV